MRGGWAGPKLEDFLGAAQSQAMALSLDNASSFYYYGNGGGVGHHHGGLLQADAYVGPAALVADDDEAAMASWVAARAETAAAGFLSQSHQQQHHHPPALSMGSACVTAAHTQGGVLASATMDGVRKRGGAAGPQKQPVHHRKSIDTFGQRTSQYRGVTR
jgi:AP2-like factor, ANT lineage